MTWSLQDYCEDSVSRAFQTSSWDIPDSSRFFLESLNLPTVHPFCKQPEQFNISGVPSMGALEHRFEDESWLEMCLTMWFMVAPPLLAMAELWLRLFAGTTGPVGCCYLAFLWVTKRKQTKGGSAMKNLGIVCVLTVGSSLVLMSDTYYVLNNGPEVGALLFVFSVILAMRTCIRYRLGFTASCTWLLVLLAIRLVWDTSTDQLKFGSLEEQVRIPEGLYFDSSNSFIESIVDHWPEKYRTYSIANGATPWMPSGDARTGLPFLINHWPLPQWHRVFLPTEDYEYVALDIAFPEDGHSTIKPVYLVLHGLNGGSSEEYIRDFTHRRTREGSTVVVMIARGLMDLPVRGWNIFHGARTSDAHSAATKLHEVISQVDHQTLIAVGYSMGGIVVNNYVASYGENVAVDGAITFSGGLDMRFQEHFRRAQRLWQPMLAESLRSDFLLGKFGLRVHERLTKDEMLRMMRATHITEIDTNAVVPYNGYRDLNHYYTSMSALGDIPLNEAGLPAEDNSGKIHSLAVPLCVVQAFDDPLITWRSTAQNEGWMHPESLTKSGMGNLMLLLTKAGGHVGWPTGILPFLDKWRWMSDVAMSFGQAVDAAKRKTRPEEFQNFSDGEDSSTSEL